MIAPTPHLSGLARILRAGLPALLLASASLRAAPAPRGEFVDPADPAVAAIRAAGEAAAGAVGTRLVAALTAALGDGGPEAAVTLCHTRAQPLTDEKLPAHPRAVAVKRTSLRLRNPANAPDAPERLALARVAAAVARGEPPPPVLVQRIQSSDTAAPEWRVYRPVVVQPACLACHGSPASRTPGLTAALAARYPADAANDYAVGDWRGLLRVTVTP